MRRQLLAVACVALLGGAGDVQHGDLAGHWVGTWTKAGDPLAVTVAFSRSGERVSGTFDSDALQVTGIPFREVSADGARVRFVLAGDETTTTFDGRLDQDTLSGELTEGAARGTFQLTRVAAPAPLATREVSFTNGAVTLAGELILPRETGRRPAILFLHGSGAEGRWASRSLARRFARAGFVALISDKRGAGGSTGDWRQSGFDELAGDAAAGLRFLKAQAEVDPARVGIYGHSQGGTIAPLVAARAGGLAFVIASAASGLDPAEVERYSVEHSIGVSRLPPGEQAAAKRFVRELVGVAYEGKPRGALQAMARELRGRSWYFDPPPPEHFYWSFSRRVAGFRPLVHWRQVRAPVLLVAGAHDERVPTARSTEAIAGALRAAGNRDVTVKVFPDADHAFTKVPPPTPGGWRQRVPGYADALVAWAAAQP